MRNGSPMSGSVRPPHGGIGGWRGRLAIGAAVVAANADLLGGHAPWRIGSEIGSKIVNLHKSASDRRITTIHRRDQEASATRSHNIIRIGMADERATRHAGSGATRSSDCGKLRVKERQIDPSSACQGRGSDGRARAHRRSGSTPLASSQRLPRRRTPRGRGQLRDRRATCPACRTTSTRATTSWPLPERRSWRRSTATRWPTRSDLGGLAVEVYGAARPRLQRPPVGLRPAGRGAGGHRHRLRGLDRERDRAARPLRVAPGRRRGGRPLRRT